MSLKIGQIFGLLIDYSRLSITDSSNNKVLDFTTIPYTVIESYRHLYTLLIFFASVIILSLFIIK